MKQVKIGVGIALLTAVGGMGAFTQEALAAETEYRELIKLPDGVKAGEVSVVDEQIIAVLENQTAAQAIVSYDAEGKELWRKELAGAPYAIDDQAFIMISGSEVSVRDLADGKETASFMLPDGFRMSSSGAEVALEAGHVIITGNLGARMLVFQLDGTPVADITGGDLRQAVVSTEHLMYFDGSVLHGLALSGGNNWQAANVLEPYAVKDGIIYYIKAPNEELDAPTLVARSLDEAKVIYEKPLPGSEEVRLAGTDSKGAIIEFVDSEEWAFLNSKGGERLRQPIRSASFRALENRYRPVVTESTLSHLQQNDHRLLLLQEQGTSALGNPYHLGALQVMAPNGGFNKVLEHSIESATLSPSGGAVVLGGGNLKFYDAKGNQVAQEGVPSGSELLASVNDTVYVYGGSGIAAFSGEPEPKAAAVTKISGDDSYETAALLSEAVWDSAETVVLATGESFADALSGAPLAYLEGGPLLFTEKGRLNASAKAEIERLGAKNAIILGGAPVISDAQLKALSLMNVETDRIGGVNRYETAALVSERIDSEGAVVADGATFKDVSLASVFAAQNQYPILLSKGNRLPRETTEAMAGRSDIVLAADRLSIEARTKEEDAERRMAVLAPASSFTDALSAATAAARRNASLYLVDDGGLTEELMGQLAQYESFLVVDSEHLIDTEMVRSIEALVD
ncbi:cell wall-binding repeat-containing protein [Planococcus sp. CP5-4]|uniref:cell wall-binding repeat-containing protein n=1 Tax=unclassified Planococcus (in: firmicutes) TaxID=2662419 RepID=UPI001C24CC63|nr:MULTISPECIES: cell wall-binding repeat-containing protein [unclassified Planococcus (in: firmicutes)]MBU9673871.1 cell wall-binding repeat-containing protein [Planococcus sp. CP5-4_YE]MBV0909741.1 cell wall-binding repeat-containing protein [Planococcus sp. CP5-4_UN]MBW6065225.1 cell wall-binding repeat-containing protein [Planococcus sp. CP5-4]